MKNAESILAVKFKSSYNPEKLMKVCEEDLEKFKNVPGLIQKYYIIEDFTDAISGIYIFKTKSARAAFWTSELAASIPARYGVISESLRVEQYEMAIVLNEVIPA